MKKTENRVDHIGFSVFFCHSLFPKSKIVMWATRGATTVDLLFFSGSIVDAIPGAIEDSVGVPDTNGLMIYDRVVQQNNYHVQFNRTGKKIFMEEVLTLCS